MPARTLQAVFIDWHLTLSKSIFWEHLAADHQRYQLLRHALFVTLRQYHADWMRGAWTTEQIMALVAEDTHLSYEFVFAEFAKGCQNMTFIAPEAPSLVAGLRRRGVRVVIATDNMDSFSRFTVPAMGLSQMFDDVLNSFDLRALKEDFDPAGRSLFLQDYLASHRLAPAQCVLIDDSPPAAEICERIGLGCRRVTPETPLVSHLRVLVE